MQLAIPDRDLLARLKDVAEIAQCGFSVREGLTGAGVTVLKAGMYFGSWRLIAGDLVWTSTNLSEMAFVAHSVDEAVRHTMLMILKDVERSHRGVAPRARAG